MMGKQVSLVLELQELASDSKVSVAELARKALMVASKLGIDDFKKWVQLELHGYGEEDVPSYRVITCQVKGFNPERGWIPAVFPDKKMAKTLSTVNDKQPVGELESVIARTENVQCQVPFPSGAISSLMECFDADFFPSRFVGTSQIIGILDAVRNRILEWVLKLEEEGILGEGLTFSQEEKEKAKTTDSVHIEYFHGILGNVQAKNVQIGDYASIHSRLKDAGVTQEERNELENILDELQSTKGEKRESILQRGLEWVKRNGPVIGTLSELIRGWFDIAGS